MLVQVANSDPFTEEGRIKEPDEPPILTGLTGQIGPRRDFSGLIGIATSQS